MKAIRKMDLLDLINKLSENQLQQVFEYVNYLLWRSELLTNNQSWFWTEEWQTRYKEAKEDIKSGRYKEFDNVEDLLKELKE